MIEAAGSSGDRSYFFTKTTYIILAYMLLIANALAFSALDATRKKEHT